MPDELILISTSLGGGHVICKVRSTSEKLTRRHYQSRYECFMFSVGITPSLTVAPYTDRHSIANFITMYRVQKCFHQIAVAEFDKDHFCNTRKAVKS